MDILLVSLIVLVSILMCRIVLVQNSKGGGLAAGFASSNQIMGVRKTTDFLEKATWTLAACMLVISVLAAYTLPSTRSVVVSDYTTTEVPAAPAAPATEAAPVEVPAE